MSDSRTVRVTPAQERFTSWASDVLVYTVVLNLFVEYSSAIVIDSFTISIFTAVVLKILLDLLTSVEHRAQEFVGRYSKAFAFLTTWAILVLSKVDILEVIDLVFVDHVHLWNFHDVHLLIIAMRVTREHRRLAYVALGGPEGEPLAAPPGS